MRSRCNRPTAPRTPSQTCASPALRVDDGETRRLIGREGQEAIADAAMEREVEAELETRLIVRAPSGGARPRPEGRGGSSGPVGVRPSRSSSSVRSVASGTPGAVALVGERRVGEAGADDGRPGLERRTDDLLDELPARGAEQERVGEGIDRCPGGRAAGEEQVAEPLAQARTARLARPQHADSLVPEVRLEARRLGGLAGALGPFDRDEPATIGRRGGACHAAECSGGPYAAADMPARSVIRSGPDRVPSA